MQRKKSVANTHLIFLKELIHNLQSQAEKSLLGMQIKHPKRKNSLLNRKFEQDIKEFDEKKTTITTTRK